MYSGIVQGKHKVASVEDLPGLKKIKINLNSELVDGLEKGASVSADGVCLTVVEIDDTKVSFDIMQETLNVSTLGQLSEGDSVNVERSMVFGQEIGGHPLSGHVDTMAEILEIEKPENNYIITFKLDTQWMKYIFAKGYVAVNGASLTIVNPVKEAGTFQVYLIPETLALTNLGDQKVGDKVNIEIDRNTMAIVETTESYLQEVNQ